MAQADGEVGATRVSSLGAVVVTGDRPGVEPVCAGVPVSVAMDFGFGIIPGTNSLSSSPLTTAIWVASMLRRISV